MISDNQYQELRKMCKVLYNNSKEWLPYIKDFLHRSKKENSTYKEMFDEIFPKLEFVNIFGLQEHKVLDDVVRRYY